MNKLIMHINYAESGWDTYGGKSIDQICRNAAEIGYDGIEFRSTPPKELRPLNTSDYMKQIAEAKEKHGLSEIIIGIGLADCTNPEKEVRNKCIENAIEIARLSHEICGSTMCNGYAHFIKSPLSTVDNGSYQFHGSFAASPEQWELTADSFRKFGEAIREFGMKCGLETHHCYIHDLPAPTVKLLNMIDCDAIGVNLDYGNTVFFPAPRPTLSEAINTYKEKIYHVHLKNCVAVPDGSGNIHTPLSEGQINHREYYQMLKEIGYDGFITIETLCSGDKLHYAKRDFEYFQSVMESY